MDERRSSAFFARGSSSWTEVIPKTEHNRLFLDCDYASSTLGPIADWGPSLRLYASMVFADSRGAVVYWGHNRTAIYNENYIPHIGGLHPFLVSKAKGTIIRYTWFLISRCRWAGASSKLFLRLRKALDQYSTRLLIPGRPSKLMTCNFS